MDMKVGDWVRYTWVDWNASYTKKVPHSAYAKVAALADDKGRVTLEAWSMAKITRRTKAFGQRIDKTPFRVGGTWKEDADTTYTVLAPVVAANLEAKLAAIMRYPTRAARDYARAKRRKAGGR